MKNKQNKKTAASTKGRIISGTKRRRSYVRRSFSRKPLDLSKGKHALNLTADGKQSGRPHHETINKLNARNKNTGILKLVTKSVDVSGFDDDPKKTAGISPNNSCGGGYTGDGNGGSGRWNNPRTSGLVAAVLLLAMLVTAAWSSVGSAKASDEAVELASAQTSTLKLAKEYIYAGSRMLAVEDYGISSTPTATPTPPASSNTATYVRSDTSTQGNWIGVYGSQGYKLAGDGANLPAWAQISLSNQSDYTWTTATTDARALQKAVNNGDRLAACWYTTQANTPGAQYSISFNFTDGQAHRLALYSLDWDTNNARSQELQIVDSSTGAVLDTRSVSNFLNGVYTVWQVKGQITLKVTNTGAASRNAVTSGIFIDDPSAVTTPTPTPATPTPTPTPTPVLNDYSPVGNLDSADGASASIIGWSYDPDNPSASNQVHIYIDGPAGSGTGYATNADQPRPDVNSAFNIPGNHGFNFTIPSQYLDGQQHSVYAYGIDTGTNSPAQLGNVPLYFQYPVPTPTPTPCNAPQKVKDECAFDGGTWNNQICDCVYPEEDRNEN